MQYFDWVYEWPHVWFLRLWGWLRGKPYLGPTERQVVRVIGLWGRNVTFGFIGWHLGLSDFRLWLIVNRLKRLGVIEVEGRGEEKKA
jgi:hypothetical protein